MPDRIRLFFAVLCLAVLAIAALPIIRELARPTNIWWTPRTMLVPLAEGADRVEIYVGGEPLQALLQAGRVQVAGGGAIAAADIGLRFNNSDHVRAQRLPLLLLSAAMCGADALLFLLVVTRRLVYKEGP
jgi:hypothetical protein